MPSRIQRLMDEATPRPWHDSNDTVYVVVRREEGNDGEEVATACKDADAALIVAAVNNLPAIVALVEAAGDVCDPRTLPRLHAALDALSDFREAT